MVLTLRLRFAVLLLTSFGAPAVAHSPVTRSPAATRLAPALRQPAAVVDAFHLALRQGRTADALALLADDALILESGSIEAGKAAYAAQHLAADAEFAAATTSQTYRRSGAAAGTIAWLASEGRTRGIFNGKAIDQHTTETMVLRRDADGWRIAHVHWSSRKTPAPISRLVK